jgi:hypothetical protein
LAAKERAETTLLRPLMVALSDSGLETFRAVVRMPGVLSRRCRAAGSASATRTS